MGKRSRLKMLVTTEEQRRSRARTRGPLRILRLIYKKANNSRSGQQERWRL